MNTTKKLLIGAVVCLLAFVLSKSAVSCDIENWNCNGLSLIREHLHQDTYIVNDDRQETIKRLHKLEMICSEGIEKARIPSSSDISMMSLTNIVFNPTFSLEEEVVINISNTLNKNRKIYLTFCNKSHKSNLHNLVIKYNNLVIRQNGAGVFDAVTKLKIDHNGIEWEGGQLQSKTQILNGLGFWNDTIFEIYNKDDGTYHVKKTKGKIDLPLNENDAIGYRIGIGYLYEHWLRERMFFRIKPHNQFVFITQINQ